jgi:hypothetical protein
MKMKLCGSAAVSHVVGPIALPSFSGPQADGAFVCPLSETNGVFSASTVNMAYLEGGS